MPKNRAMSTAAEIPDSKDPVVARAEVIASNDPTSPDMQASMRADATTVAVSVGALLRESREKSGLSPADIATKLRMGIKQVTALENSDYAVLPTGTFLRGFVRNYARAVALNPNEVLTLLEKTHSGAAAVKASSIVVPSLQNIKVPAPGGEFATPSGRAFVIGIVILLLLAAVWYWWEYVFPHRSEGGRASAGASQSIVVSQPSLSVPASAPSNASAPAALDVATQNPPLEAPAAPAIAGEAGPGGDAQSAAPPVAVPADSAGALRAETARARAAAPPTGGASLGFTFSGESWVEVVDGSGKTVLSRRFKAGDAEEVVGHVPFSVVIGNAKSTRMAFNGREFELAPHMRGSVARVSVK